MKSKVEPATTRIKRLLELLSSSFNLYYIKGKDMVLSDFLSSQKVDNSSHHVIILISFNMREVLQENYCNLGNTSEDKYLVQTRSQAKSSGLNVPKAHGIEKGLVLYAKTERLKSVKPLTEKRPPIPKPRMGQGRAGITTKAKVVLPTQMPIQTSTPNAATALPEPVIQSQQETVQTEHQLTVQTPIRQPTSVKQPNRS